MEWDEQPCKLDEFEEETSCILSIDENGTSNMLNINKYNENNKLFTLTGISIKPENFNEIRNNFNELKESYWEKGLFNGKSVVLHSKDIRKKQGAFNPKLINHESFLKDLVEFFNILPIKIYSVTIDKEEHCKKYISPHDPYKLSLEFIIERFCFELRRQGLTGIIVLESRGKKEDKEVLKKVKTLLKNGNMYQGNSNFSCIKGVYFNPKRTKNGLKSYWSLEICDLVTYSIYFKLKNDELDWLFSSIKNKIYGYPNYWGRGIKKFP
ncbi:DUF3800 domain-containing protein [Staphylococcus epidermidis]|uniref:DUF3800 domain-containing protein n=1 Tax=Staphylococcus epidermidis TaxID=1282 RepID=UPI00207A8C30|nr:DUF3800 domain-containing protein [Staphylococcus epidermidis]MCN0157083.1 DUF3800 domain-containing protein [Staphylococcus epidermidis]MCT2093580.1 DUF3800 domain-containing protein [Staphylococcus epidermidis]MDS3939779.1 DUF3800 domain-containing protein [Staphylococcus epidermidis]